MANILDVKVPRRPRNYHGSNRIGKVVGVYTYQQTSQHYAVEIEHAASGTKIVLRSVREDVRSNYVLGAGAYALGDLVHVQRESRGLWIIVGRVPPEVRDYQTSNLTSGGSALNLGGEGAGIGAFNQGIAFGDGGSIFSNEEYSVELHRNENVRDKGLHLIGPHTAVGVDKAGVKGMIVSRGDIPGHWPDGQFYTITWPKDKVPATYADFVLETLKPTNVYNTPLYGPNNIPIESAESAGPLPVDTGPAAGPEVMITGASGGSTGSSGGDGRHSHTIPPHEHTATHPHVHNLNGHTHFVGHGHEVCMDPMQPSTVIIADENSTYYDGAGRRAFPEVVKPPQQDVYVTGLEDLLFVGSSGENFEISDVEYLSTSLITQDEIGDLAGRGRVQLQRSSFSPAATTFGPSSINPPGSFLFISELDPEAVIINNVSGASGSISVGYTPGVEISGRGVRGIPVSLGSYGADDISRIDVLIVRARVVYKLGEKTPSPKSDWSYAVGYIAFLNEAASGKTQHLLPS